MSAVEEKAIQMHRSIAQEKTAALELERSRTAEAQAEASRYQETVNAMSKEVSELKKQVNVLQVDLC